MFAKFLTACQMLSFTALEQSLNDQITFCFKDREVFSQIEKRMFENGQSKKTILQSQD